MSNSFAYPAPRTPEIPVSILSMRGLHTPNPLRAIVRLWVSDFLRCLMDTLLGSFSLQAGI